MRTWCIAIIAGFILTSGVPDAKAAEGEGAGVRSCAYFANNYKDDPALTENLYFAWAQGYMSGLNIARRDDESGVFKSMSMEEQEAHIRAFCEANPSKKYFYAVLDLYRTLHQPEKDAK